MATVLMDCYYFWKNAFRTQLKKIVIDRQESTLTMASMRRIEYLCQKYRSH